MKFLRMFSLLKLWRGFSTISLVVTVGIGENSLLVLVKIHSFNMMFSNERRQTAKIRLDEKLCFRQNFEINLNFSKAPLAIFEYNML